MAATLQTDICVIGAGSAGLSVAAGAAQMGAEVALVEHGKMGGDCLNYGCVPSKSLLAAAKAAAAHGNSAPFGVNAHAPEVRFERAMARVREVIAAIAPHDSEARFSGLGVNVVREHGQFTGANELETESHHIRAGRFVIATGSLPAKPPVDGLDRVPYLTNETLFDLRELPGHLLIIGGGPIGVEMAQAFRRLGSEVTILEMARCLPRDDPQLSAIVLRQLETEGVRILEGTHARAVSGQPESVRIEVEQDGKRHSVGGTHLLIAAGRRAAVDDVGLDTAGVEFSHNGIAVDERLRTTNKRIYACGDVTGHAQFTHLAGYQAGIVIRNCVLRLRAKANYRALPWCTYTDPELAQTGLTEKAAVDKGLNVRIQTVEIGENDRARAEGVAHGRIKLVVDKKARVLGAGICAPHAGELIAPWILAVQRRLKLKDVAGLILPYPTLGESGKRAAGEYYTPMLYGNRMRTLVKLLQRLP